MNTKIILILVILIVAAGMGAAFLFPRETDEPGADRGPTGFLVGKNAIYVAEQAPSETVSVAVVRLEKTGFVVIHEDAAGVPGKILGVSSLLPAGETENLPPITLSRAMRDGETIDAMLHFDNSDGKFDATDDKPVLDPVGGASTMMIVTVSKDATEPGIVNP